MVSSHYCLCTATAGRSEVARRRLARPRHHNATELDWEKRRRAREVCCRGKLWREIHRGLYHAHRYHLRSDGADSRSKPSNAAEIARWFARASRSREEIGAAQVDGRKSGRRGNSGKRRL